MRGLVRLCGHLGDLALALRINLRQIECFNQVAAAGSIRKSSEVIGVAQPAITRTIKDLETALGAARQSG